MKINDILENYSRLKRTERGDNQEQLMMLDWILCYWKDTAGKIGKI